MDTNLVKAAFDICSLAKVLILHFPNIREVWEKWLFDYEPDDPDAEVEIQQKDAELLPVFTKYQYHVERIYSMYSQRHPLMNKAEEDTTAHIEGTVEDTLWLYISHMWRTFDEHAEIVVKVDTTAFNELVL